MRIPRNYASSLLNGRNRTGGSYSLLQSALSRTGRGKRLSRNAQLLSGLNRQSNLYANMAQSTGNTQKLYYNMKYHAQQVCEYGDKLADDGKTSVYAKAEESGSTAEIAACVKSFVSQYNSMLENLKESGSRTDYNYLSQLNSISGMNSSELASCGVNRNLDGTLTIDDKKLAQTDLDTLQKVWGGRSGFAGRVTIWTDSVEATAERNMEAQASTSYSKLFNNYGSSGNYFNFFG